MDVSTQALLDIFKKRNIKSSYSRIRILEYLMVHRTHPTVEEIYSKLVEEIPTLSKTTVYNALNTFVEAGLVRVITIEDNETRYDADTSDHGHFKCDICGKIYDFPVDMDHLQTEGLAKFQVSQRDVFFKGICSSCLDNK